LDYKHFRFEQKMEYTQIIMLTDQDFLSRILEFKLLFNISCYIWIIILLVLYFIIDNLIDVIIIKWSKK